MYSMFDAIAVRMLIHMIDILPEICTSSYEAKHYLVIFIFIFVALFQNWRNR